MKRPITKSDIEAAILFVGWEKIYESFFNSEYRKLNKSKSDLIKSIRKSFKRKEYRRLSFDTIMMQPLIQMSYLNFAKTFENYTGEKIKNLY